MIIDISMIILIALSICGGVFIPLVVIGFALYVLGEIKYKIKKIRKKRGEN